MRRESSQRSGKKLGESSKRSGKKFGNVPAEQMILWRTTTIALSSLLVILPVLRAPPPSYETILRLFFYNDTVVFDKLARAMSLKVHQFSLPRPTSCR